MKSQKVIRLAIGNSHHCMSSMWRIWSQKKGDIYIAVRCLGGTFKTSLHKDGKCQFGFTDSYKDTAKYRFGVDRRHIELWRLPESKLNRVLRVIVPYSELRETELHFNPSKVNWLQPPSEGKVGVLAVFVAEPNVELDIDPNSENLWMVGMIQTEIRKAYISYEIVEPDETLSERINIEKLKLSNAINKTALPSGTRAVLYDSQEGHDRCVMELACH